MSAESQDLSIISLGVSCQTSLQIRHHVDLIGELTNQEIAVVGNRFDTSTFPFDWRIMPPSSFCSMAEAGYFFPKDSSELANRQGEWGSSLPPYWPSNGSYFWHDFRIAKRAWDVDQLFDLTGSKYNHTVTKFLNRSKRSVFVLSNTQNNLETEVVPLTKLDFAFDRERIDNVRKALEKLFPHMPIELIAVTAPNLALDDVSTWPAQTYVLDHSDLEHDDVFGSYEKWASVFRDYFSKFPTSAKRLPV